MTWDVSPIAFSWGEASFRSYSLLVLLTWVAGYLLFSWQIQRGGGAVEEAGEFVVLGVLGVLVGARAGHVVFYDWARMLEKPTWALRIWEGGLSGHGALVGLVAALYWFTRQRELSLLEATDRFVFSAAAGAALVRLGALFNSESVGRVTDVAWAVRFPRYDSFMPEAPLRHPTQIYEVVFALGVLVFLLSLDGRLGKERRPLGALTGAFLLVYFSGRFGLEFFKELQQGDPTFGLTMAQILSIPVALAGAAVLVHSLRLRGPVGWIAG